MPTTIASPPGGVHITATPLTPTAFHPFGAVIQNPAKPGSPSSSYNPPPPSITANQGSATKYPSISPFHSLYQAHAPSKHHGAPAMSLFVCGARQLEPSTSNDHTGVFRVSILERHPFTTQTFIPLTPAASSSPSPARYLVIVAPSLPPSSADASLPTPAAPPGRGLPDLSRLRAFIATGEQAVTYGAGTWHAPMVALGPAGSEIPFVVVQFASGVAEEDCQEVVWEGEGLSVRIPSGSMGAGARL